MKYTIQPSNQFKRDLKLIQKRGLKISLLTEIIDKLADGEELPAKLHDHALTGNFKGCRECHISPDWLLIYEYEKDKLFLYLTRTGSHNNLFK